MAYRVEAKNVTIDASGNKTISLSDFGGDTPKLVMARSTKSTSDGNYQDNLFHSFGWGDLNQEDSAQIGSVDNVGTSEVTSAMQDNLLTAFDPDGGKALLGATATNPTVVNVTGHGYSNGDKIHISLCDAIPTINGVHIISNVTTDTFTVPVSVGTPGTTGKVIKVTDQIALVSFSADEFVINVGIYGGTAFTVMFMAFGGSTLTDVYVGSFNIPTAADTTIDTNIAFFEGGGGASTITIPGGFGIFSSGEMIKVSGSASNDGFYTIVSVTNTVITLAAGVLTDESAGPTINIVSGYVLAQGAGFSPDAGFLFTEENDNGGAGIIPGINVNARESAFSCGFFERGGTQCAECRMYSSDQEATMETFSAAGTDAACWGHRAFKSGVWVLRGSLTFESMHATDGFILKQSGANIPVISYRINYVVMKGGNYEVVQKTAPSSPGTQDIVNSGFTPSGVMFPFGHANNAAMSMGWASNKDGTKANTKEGVSFVSDLDNQATSDTKRLTKTDACLLHDFAASTSPDSEANIETWNADGVTLDFIAATAYVYHAIMFGDGTVTPVSGGQPTMRRWGGVPGMVPGASRIGRGW